MNFNIYIDNQTGAKLAKLAKASGRSRNALIREAIENWIVVHQAKSEWPKDILNFKGVKSLSSFEKYREDLKDPKEDPFS